MKYRSVITALCAAIVLTLAGCGNQPTDSGLSAPLTADEPSSAASVSTVTDGSSDAPTASTTENISSTASSTTADIGLDAAKAAALKHAGISEADASFTEAKLEYDDGKAEYDIEFIANAKRYEYEIRASDGKVLEFSSEAIPDPTGLLSEAKAKELALAHAGISEEQATFTKLELDYDNGITKYEIKFTANGAEYEIELNAKTGDILKSEIDRD